MKNRIAAIFAAFVMGISVLPAGAQVVTDPAAQALLQQILAQQITQSTQQTAALPKDILSEAHLADQVTQMIKDHVDVSSILKGLGSDLVSSITKNNDLMFNTKALDEQMNAEFKRLVPQYSPSQNYLQYINTLQSNSFQAYAQALGVANDGVSISKSSIAKKVESLLNEPPQNQLQALQQMVTIGHMQVQQMDKLLKIQAAMMKSMAVSYQQQIQSGGAGSFVPQGAVSKMNVEQYCSNSIPFYPMLGQKSKDEAFTACKNSILNRQGTGH
jgi:hypothetical protein